ncbi:MAG: hypothetical protein KY432_08180 [Acidobacteria bacterium]|nr:hypothetical protein [Acidobacteriota bacterium]
MRCSTRGVLQAERDRNRPRRNDSGVERRGQPALEAALVPQGGEASDQQWRDIIGLFRVSGDSMDRAYLRRWAVHHGVADLLERASEQGKI